MGNALVIGGTKGLGASLAKELSQCGFSVTATGRSANKVTRSSGFEDIHCCPLDLNDIPMARATVSSLCRSAGPFDLVLWVAGIFLNKPLVECTTQEVMKMLTVHNLSMVEVLRSIHQLSCATKTSYSLCVISSTSSFKLRDDEDVYCMVQAGKAAFVRNFGRRIIMDLPGSRVTLILPGGMATGFFNDNRDLTNYMNTDLVAQMIVRRLQGLGEVPGKYWDEYRIIRSVSGFPLFIDGPAMPEQPDL